MSSLSREFQSPGVRGAKSESLREWRSFSITTPAPEPVVLSRVTTFRAVIFKSVVVISHEINLVEPEKHDRDALMTVNTQLLTFSFEVGL